MSIDVIKIPLHLLFYEELGEIFFSDSLYLQYNNNQLSKKAIFTFYYKVNV